MSATPPQPRPWMKVLMQHDEQFFRESRALVAAAGSAGKTSAKLKHLIWLAVDSVVMHLYAPGAALHAQGALEEGATIAEVMDTLRLAGLGLDAGLRHGFPILLEELERRGEAVGKLGKAVSSHNDWKTIALQISPDFVAAYEAVLRSPVVPAALDPRSRALIGLAVASCPAVADREGMRRLIAQALDLGSDALEIIEVMQVASLIGMHGLANGLGGMAPALSRHAAQNGA